LGVLLTPTCDKRLVEVNGRKVNLPTAARIAYVSIVAANLIGPHLLRGVLASATLPLDELSRAHLVAIECPSVSLGKFEYDLPKLVTAVATLDRVSLCQFKLVYANEPRDHSGCEIAITVGDFFSGCNMPVRAS
jgi:hypothetical protein